MTVSVMPALTLISSWLPSSTVTFIDPHGHGADRKAMFVALTVTFPIGYTGGPQGQTIRAARCDRGDDLPGACTSYFPTFYLLLSTSYL